MKEQTLQGKNAIVTGGSRGIGRAIAVAFAQRGANVAIVYAGNNEAASETVALIEACGVKGISYCCNVADFEAVKATVADIKSEFGSVDILVNNAGIIKDGLIMGMKEEDFDSVIATNLKGTFNFIKQTYPLFARQRSGKIINVASVSGLLGNAGQANYAAAKAGIIGLTKTTARELAGRGINCNAIAPGFIKTDMTDSLPEDVKATVTTQLPLKRIGEAEEVAALAVFLAGSDSNYITGEVIKIDGGLYI